MSWPTVGQVLFWGAVWVYGIPMLGVTGALVYDAIYRAREKRRRV